MAEPRFDPSKPLTFDLERGQITQAGAGVPVLVSAEALVALCGAAGPTAAAAFGRSLGDAIGRRIWALLGAQARVRAATVAEVVDQLGGEIALAGLGETSFERWGQALVAVLDRSPLGAAGDVVIQALLQGALRTATERPVRALLLSRDGIRARFFLGSVIAIDRLRGWLEAGVPWGDAVVRLHAAGARGGE